MINLIKMELYKLKRQKLVMILLAAVVALSAFSAFSEINLLMVNGPIGGKASFANAFQDVFMLFLIAVFGGFYIGADFSNRTIQAELARGHRRVDLIAAKALVFVVGSGILMLLYPVTVCLIHTVKFGWGEEFDVQAAAYVIRVALLGSVLNMGTASIYVCLAFLCRDVPKTICACFAFPVVFSAVSSTLGARVAMIGKVLDDSTLSQLKYIVSDGMTVGRGVGAVVAAVVTAAAAMAISYWAFVGAEIR